MPLGHIRPAVAEIEEQQILAVSKLALGDPSVIALWYGESDLPTDPALRQPAIDSLNAGETFYTPSRFGFEKTVAERLKWWAKRRVESGTEDEGAG